MSASAKANPHKFYIGIDGNKKPLEKLSTKITRKPSKGGLPNAMFIQAAVEDLPCELDGVADEIYINFPWGSLLGAVATGDTGVLLSLRRLLIVTGRLVLTIGIDPTRDRSELDRLGLSNLDYEYLNSILATRYLEAGLRIVECSDVTMSEWSRIETSWARKLGGNDERTVFCMVFVHAW